MNPLLLLGLGSPPPKAKEEDLEKREKAVLEGSLLTETHAGELTRMRILRERCRDEIQKTSDTLDEFLDEDDLISQIGRTEDEDNEDS